MRTALIIATSALLAASAFGGGTGSSGCPIVPVPKVYKPTGDTAELLDANAAAIVLGAKATPPEQYAAKQFQTLVQRRFKRVLPVVVEDKAGQGVRQAILLGQRQTNTWLDRVCTDKGIELSAEKPGHDGFIIEIVKDGERQVIVVGGSNPRGVTYGQHALFDLLRAEGEKVVFPVASVRDWPSIAWRGRPHVQMRQHVEPGVLDAYVRARLNFIDLRDEGGKNVAHGFPATPRFPAHVVRRVLAEAHRRGLFVYGTVTCGVKRGEFPAVLDTFAALIEHGVDGIWLSFDDSGAPPGAEDLIRDAIELAGRHGITGRAIATTPPMGSYQKVDTPANRKHAAVPGFDAATWFFTALPSQRNAAAAQAIGLKRPPSWWHNWPRPRGGLLHEGYSSRSLREQGRPAYLELSPLSEGWHKPRYAALRDGPRHVDAVMLWGHWVEEYVAGAMGLWAWAPEKHDWARTRRAVHGYVFGASLAPLAEEFDEALARVKALFILPDRKPRVGDGWPPRLRNSDDQATALKLFATMDERLKRLEAEAPAQTALERTRLERLYLEPMRATVDYGRKMAELELPDHAMLEFQDRIFELIAYGTSAEADRELTKARAELLPRIQRVQDGLAGLEHVEAYTAELKERLLRLSYWVVLAEHRTKRLEKFFGMVKGRDFGTALAPLATAPGGKALAEATPADWLRTPVLSRGEWGAGLMTAGGHEAVGIVHPVLPYLQTIRPGQFAEVRTELPLPRFQGRLLLETVVCATPSTSPKSAYLVAELRVNGRLVWEQDVTAPVPGKQRVSVDVTDAVGEARKVKLRFRVVNRRRTSRFNSATFLGPVRLRAVAQ